MSEMDAPLVAASEEDEQDEPAEASSDHRTAHVEAAATEQQQQDNQNDDNVHGATIAPRVFRGCSQLHTWRLPPLAIALKCRCRTTTRASSVVGHGDGDDRCVAEAGPDFGQHRRAERRGTSAYFFAPDFCYAHRAF